MPLPSPKELHMEMPLYEVINLGAYASTDSYQVVFYSGTIDAFCLECEKEGVFRAVGGEGTEAAISAWDWNSMVTNANTIRHFSRQFICARDSEHRFRSYFRLDGDKLIKIGQYPSVADFQSPGLQKYKSVLGKDRHRELVRAVGLAAHGVGIGSFVYLRRVFESLIEDAHRGALTSISGFDDEEYQHSRVEEKILMLKVLLPPFLVENRAIYSILSVGVHSLTEEECLEHYGPMRVGIELILDQRLEQEKRQEKETEAKKAIAKIHQKVKE